MEEKEDGYNNLKKYGSFTDEEIQDLLQNDPLGKVKLDAFEEWLSKPETIGRITDPVLEDRILAVNTGWLYGPFRGSLRGKSNYEKNPEIDYPDSFSYFCYKQILQNDVELLTAIVEAEKPDDDVELKRLLKEQTEAMKQNTEYIQLKPVFDAVERRRAAARERNLSKAATDRREAEELEGKAELFDFDSAFFQVLKELELAIHNETGTLTECPYRFTGSYGKFYNIWITYRDKHQMEQEEFFNKYMSIATRGSKVGNPKTILEKIRHDGYQSSRKKINKPTPHEMNVLDAFFNNSEIIEE